MTDIYPFLDNKYRRWHDAIVERARTRERLEGYVERHHVIPRCLGGGNEPENIVVLTLREHYMVHLLLTKMTKRRDRSKMCHALWRMCNGHQGKLLNSRQYEFVRNRYRKNINGKGNPMWGYKFSVESKEKISRAIRGDKHTRPWLGRKHTKESRRKISENNGRPWLGKHRSLETREKISRSQKGSSKPKTKWCKNCDRWFEPGSYTRWHGDKCKRLLTSSF